MSRVLSPLVMSTGRSCLPRVDPVSLIAVARLTAHPALPARPLRPPEAAAPLLFRGLPDHFAHRAKRRLLQRHPVPPAYTVIHPSTYLSAVSSWGRAKPPTNTLSFPALQLASTNAFARDLPDLLRGPHATVAPVCKLLLFAIDRARRRSGFPPLSALLRFSAASHSVALLGELFGGLAPRLFRLCVACYQQLTLGGWDEQVSFIAADFFYCWLQYRQWSRNHIHNTVRQQANDGS